MLLPRLLIVRGRRIRYGHLSLVRVGRIELPRPAWKAGIIASRSHSQSVVQRRLPRMNRTRAMMARMMRMVQSMSPVYPTSYLVKRALGGNRTHLSHLIRVSSTTSELRTHVTRGSIEAGSTPLTTVVSASCCRVHRWRFLRDASRGRVTDSGTMVPLSGVEPDA